MVFSSYSQKTQKDTIAVVEKYQNESMQALFLQDYEIALAKLVTAEKMAAPTNNVKLKANLMICIARVYYIINNYDKAKSEAAQAITLLKDKNEKSLLALSYKLYGLILTQLKEFQDAEEYMKNANNIYIGLGDEKGQAEIIFALGVLEEQRGNYKNAINYFDAAIPLFNKFNFIYLEAFSHLNKASSYLYLENDDPSQNLISSKAALKNALEILESNPYAKLKKHAYRIAANIALIENNIEEAQYQFGLYTSISDSLNQVFIKAISKGVDVDKNIGDLNRIIATQQSNIDKQRRSINFGKMTTGLSIALIVILSLLTLSLYKNNNLRAKANELLQDKNSELQLAKEKAEKASLAKAQFLSTITHELRTPLYAVTGLTHLLMEEDPTPEQKEHLDSLKFSGEYLLSLINNILDLNKLEANKVEVEKTSFNLKKRVTDVLVALKKSADDKNNNLHFEYDDDIPVKLLGDPLKLSQILINLIGNSLKFTQNGDIYVRIQKGSENNDRTSVRFEIEDNGVGISRKKQKSIFEIFSQASLQINRKFGGTGLGLSIVKNLLELMGSKIQLESQLGKGSKFWFDINFAISEEYQDKNPNNIIYDVDYLALENRDILIVEDNKINQMITKKILEKNKMRCLVADNGKDAIALVKEHNFDVVLMDIHMPGISGIEATREIRKFNKKLPIIALTAVTIDENLDDFYRAGFNEIIPKPFKTEEFFEKIYRSMENKKLPVDD
ncbi:MAG: response regulator [Bacteroidetes bacterium]|nr:MAG: response regulator [Bacteroidota bacterium]